MIQGYFISLHFYSSTTKDWYIKKPKRVASIVNKKYWFTNKFALPSGLRRVSTVDRLLGLRV